jgi:uncharacterized protein YaeQ
MAARVGRVTVYSYDSSTPIWWSALASKLTRLQNVTIWEIPAEQSEALAALVQRSMELNVTIQDGAIWIGDSHRSLEVTPKLLYGEPPK